MRFQESVRLHFATFKNSTSMIELFAKSIEIKESELSTTVLGHLVPLAQLHLEDKALLERLTVWRNENRAAYPSQFTATTESTKNWLQQRMLDVPDRILFLITDRFGKVYGHLGLANAFSEAQAGRDGIEIDNVIRGEKTGEPGLMGHALLSLLRWADEKLMPTQVFLRVFAENTHAIEFYKKNHFTEDIRIPLRREVGETSTNFRELKSDEQNPDSHFVRMVFHRPLREVGKQMISTAGPSISALESWYAYDAAKNGWNSQFNHYIKTFERKFADYVGTRYAISTSSCTGALHLGLLALGIGPGDEVIVPDITWVATANAVVYTGATPVFADVFEDTWVIDPASVRKKITSKTKAIMPVHLYGHPADMDEVLAIAKEHNLKVFEDAAPAIGALYKGRRVGGLGDAAAFSFQGAKLTVSGEGGMFVTSDAKVYEKALSLWDQGRDPHRTFWINSIGWKYKMSNVQAAIGLGQLERVEELIDAKRRIFAWYRQKLAGLNSVRLCEEPKNTRSIYWMSSIQVLPHAKLSAAALREELKKHNIDTRPSFPAISQYPIWPAPQTPQPVAKMIGDTSINLPSGGCLKKEQIDYVCATLRELL